MYLGICELSTSPGLVKVYLLTYLPNYLTTNTTIAGYLSGINTTIKSEYSQNIYLVLVTGNCLLLRSARHESELVVLLD